MRVQDYLDLAASSDAASLERGLADFACRHQFDAAALALLIRRPGGQVHAALLGVAPPNFMHQLQRPGAGAVAAMLASPVPLVLDDAFHARHPDPAMPQPPGLGVVACAHLAGGRHVLLRLDRQQPLAADDPGLLHAQADTQMLVHHLCDAALRLLGPVALGLAAYPCLTPREQDVLAWTAQGKSQGTVAQILGVSPHTVDFHLRKLLRKLGVNSKQQAVLRALQLGLLSG